jgi:hypothetical protein
MDTIRHLITVFIKIALLFFLAALVWWGVSVFVPAVSLRSLFSSGSGTSSSTDWLPSPKKYSSIFKKDKYTAQVFVPSAPFSGYNINDTINDSKNGYTYTETKYITYTASGSVITRLDGTVVDDSVPAEHEPVEQNNPVLDTVFSLRSLYVRNLSIYEGGHMYTGLSFIGEARSNMFRGGRFPIVMFDQAGRVIGVSAAVATTDWSVPGWVRFETKIPYTLPNTMPCTMVFEEALTAQEKVGRNPVRVSMGVKCN